MRLILNSMMTPDGTVLVSRHRHDYVSHEDKNGNTYAVDGGSEYSRRIGISDGCTDLNVWIDESTIDQPEVFEKVRQNLHWGTRGADGQQPLRWVKLAEITDDHLKALLAYPRVDEFYKTCFKKEAKLRELI